ncbi:MAG TPA: heat-inducible transcriptional repressor HrcA [Acidimicrobiales bacterium]|nr:heat-inducible transcriptional repressor HrcA [Acidimicrobiales bacterium]
MLDERKAAILRAVVEEYIETAQPVGSGHIAPTVNVSSATVRNDMVALEHDGYLRQPHTSAGRVPTDKGYRYFVDSLRGPGHLGTAQVQQVRSFFAKAHGELEQMLHDTSRLLSDLTEHTAVVIGRPNDAASIKSVQMVGLGGGVALLVLVLSDGTIEKRTVELPLDVGDDRLAAATVQLARHLVGHVPAELPQDVPSSGDSAVDALTRDAIGALRGMHTVDDHVFVGGASRMAVAFDAVDTVREVLGILEQQYVVVTVLRDVLDRGLQVAIGAETGLETLAECSLVVAPYEIEGEEAGTIGVLGPTRMNYPQALAAVAVVSKRLSHHLTEG